MKNFEASLSFTLEYEGGYVDDPYDAGGCTNMGITIGTLQDWCRDDSLTCADVADLTVDEVADIYRANYWGPVWGDKLPAGLDLQVFDWGVNSGPSRAVRALQEVAGSPADGVMGPDTLAATEAWVDRVGLVAALEAYHDKRQRYYESLSNYDRYGNGWTARNDACLDRALGLANDGDELEARVADLEARVSALEAMA